MSENDPFPSDAADRFQIRMPKGLRDRIRAAAEGNERSMNAEIVATLSQAYPATTSASEILSELYNLFIHSSNSVNKYDRPVIHELFETLGRQVFKLEKSSEPSDVPEKDGDVDAVVTTRDPQTGQERRFVIEYKNSINHRDFAVEQLKKYLDANPEFSGGIIVIGDERLKAAQADRDSGL